MPRDASSSSVRLAARGSDTSITKQQVGRLSEGSTNREDMHSMPRDASSSSVRLAARGSGISITKQQVESCHEAALTEKGDSMPRDASSSSVRLAGARQQRKKNNAAHGKEEGTKRACTACRAMPQAALCAWHAAAAQAERSS
jgi:hypothetical protein